MTNFYMTTGYTKKAIKQAGELLSEQHPEALIVSYDSIAQLMIEQSGEVDKSKIAETAIKQILQGISKKKDVIYIASNLISKQRKNLVNIVKNKGVVAHSVSFLEFFDDVEEEIGTDLALLKFQTSSPVLDSEGFDSVEYHCIPSNAVHSVLMKLSIKERIHLSRSAALEKISNLPEGNQKKIGYGSLAANSLFPYFICEKNVSEEIFDVIQALLFSKLINTNFDKSKEKFGTETAERYYMLLQ